MYSVTLVLVFQKRRTVRLVCSKNRLSLTLMSLSQAPRTESSLKEKKITKKNNTAVRMMRPYPKYTSKACFSFLGYTRSYICVYVRTDTAFIRHNQYILAYGRSAYSLCFSNICTSILCIIYIKLVYPDTRVQNAHVKTM